MTQSTQTILSDWIEIQIRSRSDVPVLFLSGAQGIGKSTAVEHVAHHFDDRLAILGLDDFYLTKAEREALSQSVHPLFAVRGPPGTHDIPFLRGTIEALKQADPHSEVAIPKFDKRIDDRYPRSKWTTFKGRPRAVLVEGWCIGALGDETAAASAPLNAIEAGDTSGVWRRYQEDQLTGPYADLWNQADAFFHLCAPSFEQVFDWRLQQEATTHETSKALLSDDRAQWVKGFIQHYERLTRRMLSGGRRAGYSLKVDIERRPILDQEAPLIVFSDLDGTLLDHKTYSFNAALPALQALKDTGSVVVLASSKTATEVHDLRRQMGFEHCPAIVENGAGLLAPEQTPDSLAGDAYNEIRDILDQTPKDLRQNFEGFGDCTTERVSHLTGLSLEAAERAKTRRFSEPGIWSGTAEELEAFLKHLASRGITARQGGRFLTLSFGSTKADQMFKIASAYAPAPIIALGDAPNDIEMLEAANYAVVVKNAHGIGIPQLRQGSAGYLTRTSDEGPIGWNAAVLDLMRRLGLDNTAI